MDYNFELFPLRGEPTARKSIVPFRPDIVEKWGIQKGDLVVGRPAGPGCPVQHGLRVISVNYITGVIETFSEGLLAARKEPKYHDIQAYHVHAFEGLAVPVNCIPQIGLRHSFMPSLCSIRIVHTGVVNFVVKVEDNLYHVRAEDIRI
jgi:uncharacterized Fe-S cluster-containing protein